MEVEKTLTNDKIVSCSVPGSGDEWYCKRGNCKESDICEVKE